MPSARFCAIRRADLTFFYATATLSTVHRGLLSRDLCISFLLSRHARRLLAAALDRPAAARFAAQDDCSLRRRCPLPRRWRWRRCGGATAASLWRLEKRPHRPGCTARCTWRGWNGLPGPRHEALAAGRTLALELDLLDAETQRCLLPGSTARRGGATLYPNCAYDRTPRASNAAAAVLAFSSPSSRWRRWPAAARLNPTTASTPRSLH